MARNAVGQLANMNNGNITTENAILRENKTKFILLTTAESHVCYNAPQKRTRKPLRAAVVDFDTFICHSGRNASQTHATSAALRVPTRATSRSHSNDNAGWCSPLGAVE